MAHVLIYQSKEQALITGVQKTDTFNPLSEESKKIIHNMGNVEYFELCEVSAKTHSSSCVKCRPDGVMCCTCGQCLTPSAKMRLMTKEKLVQCLRKAKKNQFGSILERCLKQDSHRESLMALGWTEEKCRYLDQLAMEDKYFTATRRERQRYENNWKLTINAQRPVSALDTRDDYLEAVKATNKLRQQAEQPSHPPILPSYQTRQRPFQERQRAERQWNWQAWSDPPSSSSSTWTGSRSWWAASKWEDDH